MKANNGHQMGRMFAPATGTESEEQITLFQWAEIMKNRLPELELLHHIPNGGQRACTTARRLKAEGVKSGVPDVSLPVPRGCYHGFYVEMKVGKNKPTDKQEHWLAQLQKQGYFVMVAYSWKEAADKIEKYLALQEGQNL